MTRRALRRAAGWVAVAVLAIASALGVLLWVVRADLIAQVGTLDDNVTYAMAQGEVDLLRFVTAAQRYAAGDPGITVDELRQRADVLFSRFDTMGSGDIRRVAERAAGYEAVMAGVRRYLEEIDSVLQAEPPAAAAVAALAAAGAERQPEVHGFLMGVNSDVALRRDAARLAALRKVEYLAVGYLVLLVMVFGGAFAVRRITRNNEAQRLYAITDAIPGGVFHLRAAADGTVEHLFVSHGFAAVRGYDPQPAPGGGAGAAEGDDGLLALVVPEDAERLRAALAVPDGETAAVDAEFRIQHPRRGLRWLNLRATARAEDGLLLSGVFIDVTDRKAQERALEEARHEAEAATEAKSDFLAMMSHEIRTPMNGVMTMAELLEQTALDEDQRGMTTIIRSSAGALLTIINDILDFSKIEAGRLTVETIHFDMVTVAEEVGELLSQRAEEKGVDLVLEIEPGFAGAMVGDPVRVRQVLVNLAGNAIKFTEHGHVTIRVGAAAGGSGRFLRVEVEDSGIGMTEQQQARLFRPFQQAEGTIARRFGGTGLGLSISRRLCELMGGRIGCTSEPGRGSTFWFELPGVAAGPSPADADAGADGPGAWRLDDVTVLVVGAAGPQRRALELALAVAAPLRVEWIAADTGMVERVAAALPGDGAPVAVLLVADRSGSPVLSLPGALAGRAPVGAGLPFLLIGPRTLASALGTAVRRGVFCALSLPVRRSLLRQRLAAALGRAPLGGDGGAEPAGFAPPEVAEARAAGMLILVAEDNATNRVVIGRLLDREGYAHEIACDGAEALESWRRGGHGLLLTDFHMPEMDGFTLTRTIRAEEAERGLPRLPIVAVTADALSGTRQLSLDSGMDDYLAKPIERRALLECLDRYLPGARALRRPRMAAAGAVAAVAHQPPPEIDPAVFDVARFTDTFGAFDAEACRFLRSFLDGLPGFLERIGVAASAGDLAAVREAAHALKGAARSVGAGRTGQLAADLQDAADAGDPDTVALLASLLEATREELAEALGPLIGAPAG